MIVIAALQEKSGSDDENDEEEDVCPQDCPSEIFNKVLDLRTRRLEIENIIKDLRKSES
mgnify:CR=1 FL=1